jgi:hypothetical protein
MFHDSVGDVKVHILSCFLLGALPWGTWAGSVSGRDNTVLSEGGSMCTFMTIKDIDEGR